MKLRLFFVLLFVPVFFTPWSPTLDAPGAPSHDTVELTDDTMSHGHHLTDPDGNS